MENVTIDGIKYDMNDLDEKSRELVRRLVFVDKQINWLNSELAVCDTARIGYSKALKESVMENEVAEK
jgi:hypothetical protein